MITFFHNFANTWGAKFIFILLTLCMIVWFGLGSFSNLNPMAEKAVTVGNNSTTIQDVIKDFEVQRKKISQMTGGRYFSPEQAIESGLLLQVVGQQVSDLVATSIREKIGLTASNSAVQKYVEKNPVFSDVTGRFDKNLFYTYLTQNQMNEMQLAKKLSDELALRHLTDTIERLGYAPDVLARLLYQYQHEKRNVSGLLIDSSKIPVTQKPDENVLREYYEAEAENLIAPEYRSLNIALLTPDMMVNKIVVDDDEINTVFEQEKEKYNVPEKRLVLQMHFKTNEDALAMKEKVTIETFEKLAKEELGQTDEQTNFGEVSRNDLLDELSTSVFKANENTIIGPVSTELGHHLLYVKSIIPATTMPATQIKKEIQKRLATEKSYEILNDVVRRIEDTLGAGSSLKEATEKENIHVIEVPNVDISGKTPEGDELPTDLKNIDLLQNLFTLQKNEVSSMIEHGTGFIIAEVTDITPVSQKSFESVKKQMHDLWKADQQKEKLKEIVETALDVTKQGNPLEAQGVFEPYEKIVVKEMTRSEFGQFPQKALDRVMKQPVGHEYVQSEQLDDNRVIVFVTDKIISANPDKDELGFKVTTQTLKSVSGESLSQQVMAAFAKEFGVTVNEAEINKAFSIYQGQE